MRLRLPEQMRHVQQVAAILFQDAMQLEIAGDARTRWAAQGTVMKFGGSDLDTAQLSGNADQEVLVVVIEARQRANGVAGVGADAKLADTANVDGNVHSCSVTSARKG